MTLVRFDQVSLNFGDQPLLTGADFAIERSERVCLIGRNGAGKSSMLKLITGALQPDDGEVRRAAPLIISQVEQTLPTELDASVNDVVVAGLADLKRLRDEYDARAAAVASGENLKTLEGLQHHLEAHGGWQIDQRVNALLTELNLPPDKALRDLSGGWRRRVSLAKALVADPDLLLLDEPTNHLDLSTIQWLENRVRVFQGSVLFITHDRAFLQRLATRIVEVDRGRLTSWPGDYQNFLEKKEQFLEEEARHQALFDKKLAQEETWIRQGIKARRTRNEGRVRALENMRELRGQRLKRQATVRIHLDTAEPSGRKVIEARNVYYGYGGKTLFENFSINVLRGDRLGIVGNNGVGKSTLIRVLLGELPPQSGSIKLGTNLNVAYFDQLRNTLNGEKSVAENVGDGRDFVNVGGKDRHIVSYLNGFLFSAKRAMTPVKALSGGECNRVILAKLFTQPSNLLVLDEPTNDLDVETLEVLEDRLVAFDGTLIVVSHDREFLDGVVSSIVVFEEDGNLQEYVGGFSDWLRRGKKLAEVDNPYKTRTPSPRKGGTSRNLTTTKPKKLAYKLMRELQALPDRIHSLERDVAGLENQVADATFYQQPHGKTRPVLDALTKKQAELEQAVERWAELEAMQQNPARTP